MPQARTVLVALLLTFVAARAFAASGGTALTINHGGYLLDAVDQPISNAAATLTFRVFTGASTGSLEWEGTCAPVSIASGYYAVTLGGPACTGSTAGGLDPTLDTSDLPPGTDRWLEVAFGPVTLAPRLRLAAAPTATLAARALTADDAQTLGGAPPSAFHDAAQLTGVAPAGVLGSGSAAITTVGTIGTGAWQGTPVADAYVASAATWHGKLASVAHDATLTGAGTAASPLGANVGSGAGTLAAGNDARFGQWSGGATGLDAAQGRTSLGLGTAATTASTDYATAAQGTLASAALPRSGGTVTGTLTLPSGAWTSGGAVGVGTTAPATSLDVVGTGEWPVRLSFDSAIATHRTHFLAQRSRSGGAVASGDTLGGLSMGGKYDATNFAAGWNGGAEVTAFAAEAWSPAARGSHLAFLTTPTAGITATERVRITSAGNVGIGSLQPTAKLDVAGDIVATAGGRIGVSFVDGFSSTSQVVISKTAWSATGDYLDLPPGTWLVSYKTYVWAVTAPNATTGWLDARITESSTTTTNPSNAQHLGAGAEANCANTTYCALVLPNYKYTNATAGTVRLHMLVRDFTNAGAMSASTPDLWFKSFNAIRIN